MSGPHPDKLRHDNTAHACSTRRSEWNPRLFHPRVLSHPGRGRLQHRRLLPHRHKHREQKLLDHPHIHVLSRRRADQPQVAVGTARRRYDHTQHDGGQDRLGHSHHVDATRRRRPGRPQAGCVRRRKLQDPAGAVRQRPHRPLRLRHKVPQLHMVLVSGGGLHSGRCAHLHHEGGQASRQGPQPNARRLVQGTRLNKGRQTAE
mmetsp:Transcript_14773/g.34718  ORF Transcript_14773/g.34718 Transcript_14773/m.34718 type:complete len:203 (-) Transcript_14773:39-647(-)